MQYGGPVGAAIGAGIGFIAGLFRLGAESPEEKVRKKIKSAYGVNVTDSGVQKQIVQMAKQGFGGNLDMAIRNSAVVDLIRLYAMSTGQSLNGFPAQMRASNLVQSSGGIYQEAPFVNGVSASTGMSGRIPIFHKGIDYVPYDMLAMVGRGERITPASENQNNRPIIVQVPEILVSVPNAQDVFTTGVLRTVRQSPRTVQASAFLATKSNYNRREMTALQIAPGTLTS
jgi:hypothetical protein